MIPHISLRNYIGVGIRGPRAADSIGHRFDWHQSPAAIAAAHEAVIHAVDEANGRFSVHQRRIILAGYRSGGTMALRIAMRDPDRFAGAISLGGRMPQGAIRNFHQLRRRRMPMLWQWGSGNTDYTEETLKSDCRSSMAMGGQVEVRQYPGDDEMDTVALRDVDEWIMRRIVYQFIGGGIHTMGNEPNALFKQLGSGRLLSRSCGVVSSVTLSRVPIRDGLSTGGRSRPSKLRNDHDH